MAALGSFLKAGAYLRPDDYLVSDNHQYVAYARDDGNVVLYYTLNDDPTQIDWDKSYWSTGTTNPPAPVTLVLQSSGNLALYNGTAPNHLVSPDPIWQTNTAVDPDACIAVLQDDGNLVLITAAAPGHPGEVLWSALPIYDVQCKFMQNYRLASAVNGSAEIVAINSGGETAELFTIGSDKQIHAITFDATADTGYSESPVPFVDAPPLSLAGGVDENGHVVLFGAVDKNIYSVVENPGGGDRWGSPRPVPGVVGTVINMRTAIFDGALFLAVAQVNDANKVVVSALRWGVDQQLRGLDATMNQWPVLIFEGTHADTVAVTAFADGLRYSMPVGTGVVTVSTVQPNKRVMGIDVTGADDVYAVLDDLRPYVLQHGTDKYGNTAYKWIELWQDEPTTAGVDFEDIMVETDAAGTVHVFALSSPVAQANTLYHWTPSDTDAMILPIHRSNGMQAGTVVNGQGSIDLFAVDSKNAITHLYQETTASTWLVQTVLDASTPDQPIVEYASYATDVTVYDYDRSVLASTEVEIRASDRTRITVNGSTYFIDAQRKATPYTNGSGLLSIMQETGSLSSPRLIITVPDLHVDPNAPQIVIEPYADVENTLATVDGDALMRAETTDPEGNTALLLSPEYHDQDTADSLADSIRIFIGDASATPMLAIRTTNREERRRAQRHGHGHAPAALVIDRERFWTRRADPFAPMRPTRRNHQACRITFEGNKVRLRTLTDHHAKQIQEETMAALPAASSTGIGSWWNKIGDLLQSVVDGVVNVVAVTWGKLSAVVELMIGTVKVWFEAVVDAIEDAFDAVQLVFAQVKVFFQQLYEWLAWLFNWNNILRTKEAIAYTINQMLGFMKGAAPALRQQVDDGYEAFQSSIASAFEAARGLAGDYSVGGYAQRAEQDPLDETVTSNNFVEAEYFNNVDADDMPPTPLRNADDPTMDQLVNELNALAGVLSSSDAFAQAGQYFAQIGQNPDQFFTLLLNGMMSVAQGIVMAGIDLVHQITDTLLDAFGTIADTVYSVINQVWSIPFLSTFYRWLNKGTADLTLLDALSLAAAIPATIATKAAMGSVPFSADNGPDSVEEFKASFNSQTMLQAAGLASAAPHAGTTPYVVLPEKTLYWMRFCFLVFSVVNITCNCVNDLTPPPAQSFPLASWGGILATVAVTVFQFPWFVTQQMVDIIIDYRVVLLFVGGTIVITVAWVTAIVKCLKIKVQIPATTQILATSAAGGLLLAFNAYCTFGEANVRRVVWAILSPLPGFAKIMQMWRNSFSMLSLVFIDLVIGGASAAVGYSVLAQGQSSPTAVAR